MEKAVGYMYVLYDNDQANEDNPWEPICDYSGLFRTYASCEVGAKDSIRELCESLAEDEEEADEIENSGRFQYIVIEQYFVEE